MSVEVSNGTRVLPVDGLSRSLTSKASLMSLLGAVKIFRGEVPGSVVGFCTSHSAHTRVEATSCQRPGDQTDVY